MGVWVGLGVVGVFGLDVGDGGGFGMGYARARLYCAVIAVQTILVEKKVSYTWIHNHKKMLSTWTHAEHVKENDYLTWKRA